jgi:pSer/pThr/pTyr-binding forkhead associated (FHA) protein
MATLTIVVDGVEQRFPLEAATVTLGRGLESDIRLKDIKASRRHCQVAKTPKGYQCVDLSSGNGTYVNGIQIKQQMLGSGDKITIGSTTIVFEEPKAAAPVKPAPSKAPTAKVPVAPPAAAAPSKAATAKIEVAPTKRTTSRVDAVKPAPQGAPRPATQAVGKSGSRIGKPMAGRAGTRPRPAAEATKPKKKSPVLLIAIVAGVLALGAGGYFIFASKDGGDQTGAQIKQLMKKADDAEKAEKLDAAAQDYKKALDLCQGERYKMFASDITKALARIEGRKGGSPTPPKSDGPAKDPGPDFEARRTEIAAKHKLAGDPAAADWGGAVKDWNELLKGKSSGDLKTKAEAEIKAIQAKARQDFDRLKKKAEALAAENKMAEALDLLKQQQPRFENTELEPDIAAAIKQYDK